MGNIDCPNILGHSSTYSTLTRNTQFKNVFRLSLQVTNYSSLPVTER